MGVLARTWALMGALWRVLILDKENDVRHHFFYT